MDFIYNNIFVHSLANKSRLMKMVHVCFLQSLYLKSKIDIFRLGRVLENSVYPFVLSSVHTFSQDGLISFFRNLTWR